MSGTTAWEQLPVMGGFVISEANGMRSRASGVLKAGHGIVVAGTPVQGTYAALAPAAAPGDEAGISGILLYSYNTTAGDVEVALLARDAEVNEAYLVYAGMSASSVATRLNTALNIIVRHAVLDGPGGTFAGGPRQTDPALADSIYGPQGNAAAQALEQGAPPPTPPPSRSQPASATDRPPPAPHQAG